MAGWLAARNDGANYGQLVAFNFPKERQVDSPQQIEYKIDNDPDISEWFTLRCQEGAFCIRGNLLVIPMTDPSGEEFSLLYAEPVYLQAEGSTFPELKQVILATGEKVVMEDSVPQAVAALTGYTPGGPLEGPTDGQPAVSPSVPVDRLEQEINKALEALQGLRDNLSELENALKGIVEGRTGDQ